MATTYRDTVGTGKDYATLGAWLTARIAASSTDLVTNQEIWVAEVYGTVIETASVDFDTLTTSADYYVSIVCADGHEHMGRPDRGAIVIANNPASI